MSKNKLPRSAIRSMTREEALLRNVARFYFESGYRRGCVCGRDEEMWEQHYADRDNKVLDGFIQQLKEAPDERE